MKYNIALILPDYAPDGYKAHAKERALQEALATATKDIFPNVPVFLRYSNETLPLPGTGSDEYRVTVEVVRGGEELPRWVGDFLHKFFGKVALFR